MIQQYVVDFVVGDEQAGFDYLNEKEAQGHVTITKILERLGDAIIETTEAEATSLANKSFVAAVDENMEMSALGWVDEEQFQPDVDGSIRGRKLSETQPYGIDMVKANLLPNKPEGKEWKKVCVIDTGYENSHEDLPHLTADAGFSAYDDQEWDQDLDGHGTHCAGTIGAIGKNNVGVNSVMNTYNNSGFSNFIIATGLQNSGSGTTAGIVAAIDECMAKGANVVSMSFGSFNYQQSIKDAVESLWKNNILMVAAAGNAGNGTRSFPASYDHVISVAAVDQNNTIANFSQYNDQVEISAPGVEVISTYKGNTYKYMSGTSMAAPHVAAVAALVWTHFPTFNNAHIRYVLAETADKYDSCNINYGHGLVNAKAAYDFLKLNNDRTSVMWEHYVGDNGYFINEARYGCHVRTRPESDTLPSTPPPAPIHQGAESQTRAYVVDFVPGRETEGYNYIEGRRKYNVTNELISLGDAIIETTEAEAAKLANKSFVAAVDKTIEMSALGWVDE